MIIMLMRVSIRLILAVGLLGGSVLMAHAQINSAPSVQPTQSPAPPTSPRPAAASPTVYLPVTVRAGTPGLLRVSASNPRYFADPTGKIVYLTGSHIWGNLQDFGSSYPPAPFDYAGFLDFLQKHNHNFFRLWVWEQSRWTPDQITDDFWFYPHIYRRTGPGNALDGKSKFDLTKFNQAYFDRLRSRVIQAGNRGIYVAVMFFQGWSVQKPNITLRNNVWKGHPFNAANNINGINGDTKKDNGGTGIFTLDNPAVTALQEAYARKVIDTLNDQDNVLWDICNECPPDSIAWHNHMIEFIKRYQAGKPKQHPVGFTGDWWYSNDALFDSDADWVSPAAGPVNGDAYLNDPPADHKGKVIVLDSDHIWGGGQATPPDPGGRMWVWKSFTRGMNPIYMDGDDSDGVYYAFYPDDTQWDNLRANLGYTRQYANRMNLARAVPRPELASSGYCLADASANSPEFLVYLPDGGQVSVDLTGISGNLRVEWFNPANGQTTTAANVSAGGRRTLTSPFAGDAVLYLRR